MSSQARNYYKINTETSYPNNDLYTNDSSSFTTPPIYRKSKVDVGISLDNINEEDSNIGEWLANEEASLEQIGLRYPYPKPEDLSDNQV
jgi:hypothetical protein